jgi:hypothetical protein
MQWAVCRSAVPRAHVRLHRVPGPPRDSGQQIISQSGLIDVRLKAREGRHPGKDDKYGPSRHFHQVAQRLHYYWSGKSREARQTITSFMDSEEFDMGAKKTSGNESRSGEAGLRGSCVTVGAWAFFSWILILGPVGFALFCGLAYALRSSDAPLGVVCVLLLFSPFLFLCIWTPLLVASLLVDRASHTDLAATADPREAQIFSQ